MKVYFFLYQHSFRTEGKTDRETPKTWDFLTYLLLVKDLEKINFQTRWKEFGMLTGLLCPLALRTKQMWKTKVLLPCRIIKG